MNLYNLETAVYNGLVSDARLAGLKISTHGGEFNFEELKQYAKQTPHAVLSMLRVNHSNQAGTVMAEVLFVITVLTEDKPKPETRDKQVIDWVDALLRVIGMNGQRWGFDAFTTAPKDIAARNLFSRKIDAQNIAMWGIAWKQQVQLVDTADGPGVPLLRIHADWDLAPRDNDAPLIPADGSERDAETLINF